MVASQLGPKENWADSDDLAMMFQGAFTSDSIARWPMPCTSKCARAARPPKRPGANVLALKETCARKLPKLPVWTSC